MMKRILTYCIITIACAVAAFRSSAQQVQVVAALDSVYLLMGKQTALHLQVVQPENAAGVWHAEASNQPTIADNVEVVRWMKPDTTRLGNDRIQINRDLLIQSFDSGTYMLPPLLYTVDADTFRTPTLAIKVMPVILPDSMTTVHPLAGTVAIPRHFFDFLPDWLTDNWGWILLGILLLAAAVTVGWLYYKKISIKEILAPKPKPVPPYELAMSQLQGLRQMQLCEHGQEKEFYTRLTDILRTYLDGRFGINAMEMTSSQIRAAVRANEVTRPNTQQMSQILEMADFVKFAKMRPLPDDNTRSFNSALKFVEDTKPLPEPEPENTATTPHNPTDKK